MKGKIDRWTSAGDNSFEVSLRVEVEEAKPFEDARL
jgi:hypothetical protein